MHRSKPEKKDAENVIHSGAANTTREFLDYSHLLAQKRGTVKIHVSMYLQHCTSVLKIALNPSISFVHKLFSPTEEEVTVERPV